MQLPILTPQRVLSLTHATTRSALANAKAAGDALAQAISDRRELAPHDTGEHGALAALTEPECLQLLGSRTVGRLAYVARAGEPDIAPVNYVLDGRDVLVRSGPGPKLQAAERREVVAFEVDDLDEQAHTAWSVVVVGRARVLSEHERRAVDVPEPWSHGPRRHVVRISPSRVNGRRIT
jgi:nitroimidazol reductase NimA-like FMN-containing flavoprotein (pyridoxamine 5'-phosphate oxidase superfamily)